MEYVGTITPIQAIFARPGVAPGVAAGPAAAAGTPPVRLPGPDRGQLLEMLS